MPRKNVTHGRLVTSLLSQQAWFRGDSWHIQPLENLSLSKLPRICVNRLSFFPLDVQKVWLAYGEALASDVTRSAMMVLAGELFAITEQFQTSHNVPYYDFQVSYLQSKESPLYIIHLSFTNMTIH